MASGDTLATFTPQMNEPPTANYATLDTRNAHPILDFDPSTQESAVFTATMPRNYGAGTSIDVILCWLTGDAVTTNNVLWGVSVERIDASSLDIDADSFATAINSAATAVPGTAGQVLYTTITLTNAQADGIAAGEMFRLKVARIAADASDTMTGDASLRGVEMKQA